MTGLIVFLVIVAVVGGLIGWATIWQRKDRARLAAMEPAEREALLAKRKATAERLARERQWKRDQRAQTREAARMKPLSEVSAAGQWACPKCGGTNFKARRSGKARAGIIASGVVTAGLLGPAVGAVATKKTQVTCRTCGTRYRRG